MDRGDGPLPLVEHRAGSTAACSRGRRQRRTGHRWCAWAGSPRQSRYGRLPDWSQVTISSHSSSSASRSAVDDAQLVVAGRDPLEVGRVRGEVVVQRRLPARRAFSIWRSSRAIALRASRSRADVVFADGAGHRCTGLRPAPPRAGARGSPRRRRSARARGRRRAARRSRRTRARGSSGRARRSGWFPRSRRAGPPARRGSRRRSRWSARRARGRWARPSAAGSAGGVGARRRTGRRRASTDRPCRSPAARTAARPSAHGPCRGRPAARRARPTRARARSGPAPRGAATGRRASP